MSRSKIISELYISERVDQCINQLVLKHYREDFKQELFVIVSQIKEELLLQLHESDQLHYYVARIIINLSRQRRNIFYKQYIIPERHFKLIEDIDTNEDFKLTDGTAFVNHLSCEDFCIDERLLQEQKELELIKEINNLDKNFDSPSYRLMILLVDRYGSMREVSRKTGIDVSVISRSIKKVRKHLQTI